MQVYDLLTDVHYEKGELILGKPIELQPSDHMYFLNIYFKIKAALVNMVWFLKVLVFCTHFKFYVF